MRLTLGSRSYDLTARSVVVGVGGAPVEMVAQGADLIEVDVAGGAAPAPVYTTVGDEGGLGRALSAGAALVRLTDPTAGGLALCAAAGAAVLVPAGAAGDAAAAGLPPDRIAVDTLLVDVTSADSPAAATAVGVIHGARIVRTTDVRGARRVCDVLAAVMEAR
jgi:hypothetical protein